MAEGRMIKKRISESKKLGKLKSDSTRLLYTWLIPWLDVESRHSADPEIIKGHIFPKIEEWTIGKIEDSLFELYESNLIILYRVDGESYLQFTKCLQRIDKSREAESLIATPDKNNIIPKENSRELQRTPENSPLIKVNESKVNESKEGGHPKEDDLNSLDKEFDLFWEAYPRKVNKTDALKAFRALRRKKVTLKQIASGFNGYMDYLKHLKVYQKFDQAIMYPASFLRNDKWKENDGFKYRAPL